MNLFILFADAKKEGFPPYVPPSIPYPRGGLCFAPPTVPRSGFFILFLAGQLGRSPEGEYKPLMVFSVFSEHRHPSLFPFATQSPCLFPKVPPFFFCHPTSLNRLPLLVVGSPKWSSQVSFVSFSILLLPNGRAFFFPNSQAIHFLTACWTFQDDFYPPPLPSRRFFGSPPPFSLAETYVCTRLFLFHWLQLMWRILFFFFFFQLPHFF